MDTMIDVVLLSDKNMAGIFDKYFDRKIIGVAQYASDEDSFVRKVKEHGGYIAVIDTVSAENTQSVIEYLCKEGRKIVVICKSAKEGFEHLTKGAMDMFMPTAGLSDEFNILKLCSKIKQAHEQYLKDKSGVLKYTGAAISNKVIVIGSSTGGADTIREILTQMPENICPIVIVQHMPPVFTKMYARNLDEVCKIDVREAADGDILMPGLALVAPGDYQIRVAQKGEELYVKCNSGERYNGHAPSADILFFSAAQVLGKKAVGVILTGMGADGAKGMLEMRKNGAFTIGQDEDSSVVYGMPKVAFEMGGVCVQAHYNDIPRVIMENL
jgi:two-component system chemotaxis response regulator CheB